MLDDRRTQTVLPLLGKPVTIVVRADVDTPANRFVPPVVVPTSSRYSLTPVPALQVKAWLVEVNTEPATGPTSAAGTAVGGGGGGGAVEPG